MVDQAGGMDWEGGLMPGRMWPPQDMVAWLAEPKPPIPIQSAQILRDLIEVNPRDSLVPIMLESLTRFVARMQDEAAFQQFYAEVSAYHAEWARWRERAG